MTDELTKTFFDTFGIEPKNISTGECKYKITPEFCEINCLDCKNTIKEATYPQISDSILLELICILHKYSNRSCLLVKPYGENVEQLKKETLTSLIIFYANTLRYQKSIYREVRTLFEEEE